MILTLFSTAGNPTHKPSGLFSSNFIFLLADIVDIGSASVLPYITVTFLSGTALAITRRGPLIENIGHCLT